MSQARQVVGIVALAVALGVFYAAFIVVGVGLVIPAGGQLDSWYQAFRTPALWILVVAISGISFRILNRRRR